VPSYTTPDDVCAWHAFPSNFFLPYELLSGWCPGVREGSLKPVFHSLSIRKGWCPESDSNQRPTAYEAVALPLSYRGEASE
jgi:hypothetical protein